MMRALAFTLTLYAWGAVPAAGQDLARVDKVAAEEAADRGFMGAVLVAKGGQVLFDRGYGSANLEWRLPNDGNTKFRLGSLSKQFTAAGILLLQEHGKLTLDDPVKRWLSDVPATWNRITIRHLLMHTSGVPDFTSLPDYAGFKMLPTTPDGLIRRFRDLPLDFTPGEKFSYSNSGYVLLTAIIEKAGGQPFATFLTTNVFRPLGMLDTGYDSQTALLLRRASGYMPSRNGMMNAEYIDMSVPQGAGALYSTTHDLLKWEVGLLGGRLLRPDTLKAMITPGKENYAFGLQVEAKDGFTTISHGGGIEGFNSWLGYDPIRKLVVVVLANINGPSADHLGPALLTLARGGSVVLPNERAAITLTADQLKEYVGTYDLNSQIAFSFRVESGMLIAEGPGQLPMELLPERPDQFFSRKVDAQWVFKRDAKGRVATATLQLNGRELVVNRR